MEPKATRSGNARIHGMTQVTVASIAYVATQVLYYTTFVRFFPLLLLHRSDSPYHLLQHSLGPIPSPTLNVSTTVFSNFLKI